VTPAALQYQFVAQRRGDLTGLLRVDLGEQIHIAGGAVGEPVDNHRTAAGQRQGVPAASSAPCGQYGSAADQAAPC
jgi:hypothetical protein